MILLALALAAGPDPTTIVGPPAGTAPAAADLDRVTHELSKKIRCPVCQGLSVGDSPSESARAMKDEVKGLVAQGYTEDQVINYFEASYGEFIRLEPTTEGWNVLVWTLPVALLVGGAGWVAWTLRTPGKKVEVAEDPALKPYIDRVLAEVGDG